jgi:tripartite-type tricarboxylate transporter receptor subunit TctC
MDRISRVFAAALCGLLAATAVQAQSVDEFYKGKQLTLISGNTAGDRGDVVARLMVKHLANHIPGKPVIIVQNMPAAGGLVAANHLFNIAAKDGTIIGNFSRSIPVQAVMGQAETNYDPRKFGWLGSPETTEQLCVANADAPVQKAEDLFSKELIVGSTGPTAVTTYLPLVVQQALGMKFNIVSGYKGANDMFLAMERKETQGACTVLNNISTAHPDWIPQGKVHILFHTGTVPSTTMPKTPSIYQFVKNDEQKQVIFLVNSGVEFGRPFVTPPGVPADRFKMLREAFAAAMKDPEFIAEAKKIDLDADYTPGERMDKLVADLYATPKDQIERAAKIMGFK